MFRWVKNLTARSTLVDYRLGHSGRPKTEVTPENAELVRQEMEIHAKNYPWQSAPSLRRNLLDIKFPPTIVTGEYQKFYVVIDSFSQFE